MLIGGRPVQRSGEAPASGQTPVRVALGRPLRGVYVQAAGAALEVSWNGRDWLRVEPGPPQPFAVTAPELLVRSTGAAARYSVLGVLV